MKKFVLLFKGGEPQHAEIEKHMEEWAEWIQALGEAFLEGYPFAPSGKVITGKQKLISDFPQTETAVAGYAVIETVSLEGAIEIAQYAPNLHTGGSVEIRPILEMP